MHDGDGIKWMAKHSGSLAVLGRIRPPGTRSTLASENSQVAKLRVGRAGELQTFRLRQAFSPVHH